MNSLLRRLARLGPSLVMLALAPGLRGQAIWTQVGTGDWTVSGNWQVGLLPDESTSATIANGGTATLSVSGAAAYLAVGDTGTGVLELNAGAVFTAGQSDIGLNGGTGSVLVSGSSWSPDSLYIGANSGTGSLTISSGSVAVTSAFRVGNASGGNGTVTMAGGTLSSADLEVGSNVGGTGSFTIDGGAVEVAGQVVVGVTSGGSNGTLTLNSGTLSVGTQLYVGTGGGTGALNLHGGVLTAQKLNGDGGFGSGNVTFNGGTLRAAADQSVFFQGFSTGDVQIAAGGATIDTQNFSIGISPVLQGVGGLTKEGAGTLTLSGSNSYSGATTVNAGTLAVNSLANGGANSRIGSSSSAASSLVLDGGTLSYTGSSVTTDRLFSVGTGGGTLSVATSNQTLTLSNTGSVGFNGQTGARTLTLTGAGNGALAAVVGDNSGATALVKSGAGTWTLSGNSTYSGATSVNAGTLKVTGSIASSSLTTVASGAKLTGTGTTGPLSIQAGGTLAPGNSPGTLSAGDTTFGADGIFHFEINQATGGLAGTNWDLLSISGTLAIAATSADPFAINLTSLTLGNVAGLTDSFNAASSYYFVFATATGGITGFSADKFLVNTAGFQNSFTEAWTVTSDGTNLALSYNASPVPEPSTYAAVVGAMMLGLALWRRRRRQPFYL